MKNDHTDYCGYVTCDEVTPAYSSIYCGKTSISALAQSNVKRDSLCRAWRTYLSRNYYGYSRATAYRNHRWNRCGLIIFFRIERYICRHRCNRCCLFDVEYLDEGRLYPNDYLSQTSAFL